MAKIRIKGDTSGYVDIQAPAVAGATTINTSDIATAGGVTTADSAEVLTLNRTSSAGSIINLQKDGSTVGSIGVYDTGSGLDVYMADTVCGIRASQAGTDNIMPCNADGSNSDADIDLGSSTTRFRDIFLSGGAYLGGTTSANYLTDYEEGSWTPAYYVRGNRSQPVFTSGSYDAQVGRYVKVGRVCHCHITIYINGGTKDNDPSTDVAINLPFTADNDGYQQGAQGLNYISGFPALNDSYRIFTSFIDQNLDELLFRRLNTDGTNDNVGCSELGSNASIYMNFSYITKD
jgi:hypothetical protein